MVFNKKFGLQEELTAHTGDDIEQSDSESVETDHSIVDQSNCDHGDDEPLESVTNPPVADEPVRVRHCDRNRSVPDRYGIWVNMTTANQLFEPDNFSEALLVRRKKWTDAMSKEVISLKTNKV